MRTIALTSINFPFPLTLIKITSETNFTNYLTDFGSFGVIGRMHSETYPHVVIVKHGAQRAEISLASRTTVCEFLSMVEHLFGIPSSHQKIVCAGQLMRVIESSRADDAIVEQCVQVHPSEAVVEAFLSKCKSPNHVVVYGVKSLSASTAARSDQVDIDCVDNYMDDTQVEEHAWAMLQTCSALFGQGRPLSQPRFSFVYFAQEGGPVMSVCGPCAHTCLAMRDVIVTEQLEQLGEPFVCQCCSILKTGHACFWKDDLRSAATLASTANKALCSSVVRLWDQQQRWFLQNMANAMKKDVESEQKVAQEALTAQLKRSVDMFAQYDNMIAQDAARRVVPVQVLLARVAAENAQAQSVAGGVHSSSTHQLTDNEKFLKHMLHWFKHEFFTWVNNPPCDHCGSKNTTAASPAHPTPEEVSNWASVVETYLCQECQKITRFPRYNKALRLLTWRKGRCGEWANCFCLLCIAMGYETRYVLDLTDHVWVEVFIYSLDRWVHLDPCEDAFDTPHMYEVGWGKKLNYVFSFSNRECLDVTRRYSQHPAQLPARNKVSEAFLSSLVAALDSERLLTLPAAQVQLYAARRAHEFDSLARGLFVDSGAAVTGRVTGSLEWKAQRGEDGASSSEGDAASSPRTVEWLEQCLTRQRYDVDAIRIVRREMARVDNSQSRTRRGPPSEKMTLFTSSGGISCTSEGLVFPLQDVGQSLAQLESRSPILVSWGLRFAVEFRFAGDDINLAACVVLRIGSIGGVRCERQRRDGALGGLVVATTHVNRSKFYRNDAITPTGVLPNEIRALQCTTGSVEDSISMCVTVDKLGAMVVELRIGSSSSPVVSVGTIVPLAKRHESLSTPTSLLEGNQRDTFVRSIAPAGGLFESLKEGFALQGSGVVVTAAAITAAFMPVQQQ